MAWVTERITKYQIRYKSYRLGTQAQIWCYNGTKRVGGIYFEPDDAEPTWASYNDGRINLYYPLKCFNDIITILRYEKPLFIGVNTQSGGSGSVGTASYESIGEEES